MKRGAAMYRLITLAIVLLTVPALTQGVEEELAPWTPGTLDIHQIATGRGNAAFVQFPAGATLLIDAGDAGDVQYADPLPNGSRPPGEWVARYVARMMRGRDAHLDYVLLTHFHPDHVGGIARLGALVPIGTIVDRGYDYLPPPATDRTFAGYRRFVDAQVNERGAKVVHARAGTADQIVDGHSDPAFEVRVVAVNDQVWTGEGAKSVTRFPALSTITVAEDRPTENMCSVALRIRYGRFDYFTGGDMPGYPVPGAPPWHDTETDVARAIGPTDVHVVNHHGSIEEENPFWLATLRSRVLIVPAWSATHPSPDVLKRMLSRRVYPEPRDIFVTVFRDATKAATGPRALQVTSDHGHVVIRVEPGGRRYWVVVLDDLSESYRITSVHGPYDSQ
jgi:glyoxylase-like metal-dependent hydrolase (beta-lactamase superfamily II)